MRNLPLSGRADGPKLTKHLVRVPQSPGGPQTNWVGLFCLLFFGIICVFRDKIYDFSISSSQYWDDSKFGIVTTHIQGVLMIWDDHTARFGTTIPHFGKIFFFVILVELQEIKVKLEGLSHLVNNYNIKVILGKPFKFFCFVCAIRNNGGDSKKIYFYVIMPCLVCIRSVHHCVTD